MRSSSFCCSEIIVLNGESSIRVRPPVLHPESDFTDYTLTEDSFYYNNLGHYKYKHIFYKYDSAIKKNILIMILLSEYFANNEMIIIFVVSK